MSLGGFDRSSFSPSANRNGQRLNSGPRLDFERPRIHDGRRSPSPGPSRGRAGYDSYVPNRGGLSHRGGGGYTNSYRPGANSWRPDPDRSYRPRSPSPDHYEPRYSDGRTVNPPVWPERRSSPPPAPLERGRRDILAQPMFEPSDAWKQTHVPGEEREASPERFRDHRPAPHQRPPLRDDFNSYRPGGDSYRPGLPRAEYRYARQPDSYRPQYDDSDSWTPSYSGDNHPGGHYRRAARSSYSPPRGRITSREFTDSRYPSDERSMSRSSRSTRSSSPTGSLREALHRDALAEIRSGGNWNTSRDDPDYRTPMSDRSFVPRKRRRTRSSSHSSRLSRHYRTAPPPPSPPLRAEIPGQSPRVFMPRDTHAANTVDEAKPGLRIRTDGLQHTPNDRISPSSTYKSDTVTSRQSRMDGTPIAHPSLPRRPESPLVAKRQFTDGPVGRGPQSNRRKKKRRSGRKGNNMPFASGVVSPEDTSFSAEVSTAPHSAVEITATHAEISLALQQCSSVPVPPPLSPSVASKQASPVTATKAISPAAATIQPPPSTISQVVSPIAEQSSLKPSSETAYEPPVTDTPAAADSPTMTLASPAMTLSSSTITLASPAAQPRLPLPPPHSAEKSSVTHPVPRPSSTVSSTERSPSLKTPAPLGTPPEIAVAPLHVVEHDEVVTVRQSVPDSKIGPRSIQEERSTEAFSVRSRQAQSLREALQVVVSTREKYDLQPREARVHPVMMANRALRAPIPCADSSPEELVREVIAGNRASPRLDTFSKIRPLLVEQVATRHELLEEKTKRLRKQYLELHEAWQEHCNRLDTLSQAPVTEEVTTVSGRTTRRSAAVLGDAVRSDLEMEQIIASLGNEDLMDPAYLSLRNVAQIPDMISVTRGKVDYVYDDTNNIVDDPASFYEPVHRMGSWTEEEQVLFLEKFAAHPKQFGIIAQSLPHKTPAQCVQFYYLHKKNIIDFRRLVARYGPRKRGGRKTDKKKGNALLTDILKHDAEVSKGSKSSRNRKRVPAGAAEPRRPAARKNMAQIEQTPTTTPTPEPDLEPRSKRRRVGTVSKLTAATADGDDGDPDATDVEPKPLRRGKRARKTRGAVTASATPPDIEPSTMSDARFVDQSETSSRRKSAPAAVHWSNDDRALFLRLLGRHGDDFKRIAASMPNKTTIQVSTFYKANLLELDLEAVVARAPKRSPTPGTPRGSRMDVSQYPGTGIMSPSTNTVILANAPESTPYTPFPFEPRGGTDTSGKAAYRVPTTTSDVSTVSAQATDSLDTSSSVPGILSADLARPPYTQILPRPHGLTSDMCSTESSRAPSLPSMYLDYSFSHPQHLYGPISHHSRSPPHPTVAPPTPPAPSFPLAPPLHHSFAHPPATGAYPQAPPGIPMPGLRTTEDLIAYLEHHRVAGVAGSSTSSMDMQRQVL